MKFLTREWHSGILNDNEYEDRYAMYQEHLVTMRQRLPETFHSFLDDFGLHDGLIQQIIVDYKTAEILILLRCGDMQEGYFDAELSYQGVNFRLTDLKSLK